jgi:multicomponent Na+:H+ antiporter subunit E
LIQLLSLALALGAFWLALSSHVEPLFLGFAAVSVLATLALCARLKIIDREAAPYVRLPQLVAHVGWLAVQVLKANIAVIGAILSSRAPNPAVARVQARAKTDLGMAIFANSITLTPGTVTVDVDAGVLLVHALRAQDAAPGAFDAMNFRAARAGDGKAR